MDVVMPKRSASTPQSAPLTLIDLKRMALALHDIRDHQHDRKKRTVFLALLLNLSRAVGRVRWLIDSRREGERVFIPRLQRVRRRNPDLTDRSHRPPDHESTSWRARRGGHAPLGSRHEAPSRGHDCHAWRRSPESGRQPNPDSLQSYFGGDWHWERADVSDAGGGGRSPASLQRIRHHWTEHHATGNTVGWSAGEDVSRSLGTTVNRLGPVERQILAVETGLGWRWRGLEAGVCASR